MRCETPHSNAWHTNGIASGNVNGKSIANWVCLFVMGCYLPRDCTMPHSTGIGGVFNVDVLRRTPLLACAAHLSGWSNGMAGSGKDSLPFNAEACVASRTRAVQHTFRTTFPHKHCIAQTGCSGRWHSSDETREMPHCGIGVKPWQNLVWSLSNFGYTGRWGKPRV